MWCLFPEQTQSRNPTEDILQGKLSLKELEAKTSSEINYFSSIWWWMCSQRRESNKGAWSEQILWGGVMKATFLAGFRNHLVNCGLKHCFHSLNINRSKYSLLTVRVGHCLGIHPMYINSEQEDKWEIAGSYFPNKLKETVKMSMFIKQYLVTNIQWCY